MKKSTMSAITALSVAGVLAVGLGAVSSWYTNWDVDTWFGRGNAVEKPTDKPDEPAPDLSVFAYDENGNGITDGDELPASMTFFRSTQSLAEYSVSASITLTATITPDDADIKSVAWIARYIDSSVSDDVSEFVTVTQNGENSLNATVECKQAFGDKIEVVCSVTDVYDETKTVVCSLDYLSRIEKVKSITYSYMNQGGGQSQNQTLNNNGSPMALNMYNGSAQLNYIVKDIAFGWSVGTVRDEVDTSIEELTVTYSCPWASGAKSWNAGKTATALKMLDYIRGASGASDVILNNKGGDYKKPNITVTYGLPNGQNISCLFKCNCLVGLSDVEMDNPDHVFGQ